MPTEPREGEAPQPGEREKVNASPLRIAWLRALADDPRLFGHSDQKFGDELSSALMEGVAALRAARQFHEAYERCAKQRDEARRELAEAQSEGGRLRVEMERFTTPRRLDDWHDDHGTVLWWNEALGEPPHVGSPLDSDWPGDEHFTHWTPIPNPQFPVTSALAPAPEVRG